MRKIQVEQKTGLRLVSKNNMSMHEKTYTETISYTNTHTLLTQMHTHNTHTYNRNAHEQHIHTHTYNINAQHTLLHEHLTFSCQFSLAFHRLR